MKQFNTLTQLQSFDSFLSAEDSLRWQPNLWVECTLGGSQVLSNHRTWTCDVHRKTFYLGPADCRGRLTIGTDGSRTVACNVDFAGRRQISWNLTTQASSNIIEKKNLYCNIQQWIILWCQTTTMENDSIIIMNYLFIWNSTFLRMFRPAQNTVKLPQCTTKFGVVQMRLTIKCPFLNFNMWKNY